MLRDLGLALLLAIGARSPGPAAEDPTAGRDASVSAPVFALAEDGAYLVAWEGRAGENLDVRFNRREPGVQGAWGDPRRLSTDATGAATSLEPRLAVGCGGHVFAAWLDKRHGRFDVHLNRSTDGGRTWLTQDVRIESDAPGAAVSSMPALAADGTGRVYCAWEDLRHGDRDIYFTRSTDDGVTWDPDRRIDTDEAGAGSSFHPLLAAWDDGTLVLGWWDERDGLADLYVRRSTDAGLGWEAPERRLDPDPPGSIASHDARFVTRGDTLLVRWTEGLAGGAHEVCRVSSDRGATWGMPAPCEDEPARIDRITGADGTVHRLRVVPGRGAEYVLEYVREAR